MDFGLSSVERYLSSSRLVYRQNKLPETIIYLVPEALEVFVFVTATLKTSLSHSPAPHPPSRNKKTCKTRLPGR